MRSFRLLLCALVAVVAGGVFRWLRPEPAAPPVAGPAAADMDANLPAREGKTDQRPFSPLFEYVRPANADQLTARRRAPSRAVQYVRVDRELIEGKQSPFWRSGQEPVRVELPDGTVAEVQLTGRQSLGPNRFVSTGTMAGESDSRVVFAYNEGHLTGWLETTERTIVIRPAGDGLSQVYEVDPGLVGTCGGSPHPVIDGDAIASAARRGSASADRDAGIEQIAAGDAAAPNEIHLLLAYTAAARNAAGGSGAVQSECDAAVVRVNTDLAASQISARIKLVSLVQTSYDETLSASDRVNEDALRALRLTTDGKMDELHAVRDSVGADLVGLIVNRTDTSNSVGIGYIMDTPAISGESESRYNAEYAFLVVQHDVLVGSETLPHEIGHVMGCAHARGDPDATGTKDGAFSYSYGYRFFGSDTRRYRDIMAYAPGTRVGYYSNPNVTAPAPISVAVGVASGAEASNCALTIERTAFEVANYRVQQLAAPAGTLVNVSTRAYVGSGEQSLIAGFAIKGTQPKQMLIRAAGPAMIAAGVTNAVSNPKVDLFAGSSLIGGNDDWGNQEAGGSAAEVSVAADRVGAFPFPAGSADAARLITLNPGPYTAVVSGVGGASGTALVEAYEIDRTGEKLVNLSTRGYADKGKEMVGGFVVSGDAGTTKRILIRVQGPTLANYGVTGVMEDPTLALYNAAREQILWNDDWAGSTVTGEANPTDDKQPLAETYGEQQIFATGFAPGNRREPCVLLDLAPGTYTVIVEPFENLTRTPAEVAVPGVAIVEVFEIAP